MESPEKAYIKRDVLQEGLSYGILNALASAREMGKAYSSALRITKDTREKDMRVIEIKNKINICDNDELRKGLQKELRDTLNTKEPHVTQTIIDEVVYHNFMADFYELWLAYEWQITVWSVKELPDYINGLFNAWFNKEVHPQDAIALFREFLHCLKKSSIYDLTQIEVPER